MNSTFTKHITSDLIDFKYALGTSDRSGREFHNFHEIIYLMGGDVEFISDSIHTRLTTECFIIIPKDSYHQLIINGNQDTYYRCLFNFFDIDELVPLIKKKLGSVYICNASGHQKYLVDKMINLTKKSDVDRKTQTAVLHSVLTLLLTEISAEDSIIPVGNLSAVIQSSIEFINQNLCKNISVPDIAAGFNVSTSGLAHTFKKEMHISIYKYILKKRLMLAHEKLLLGEPATQVASDCGFYDYSGFYKVYKKEFGTAPSQIKTIKSS